MSIEVPQYEAPSAPASGRTLIFANPSGNICTKDASGDVRIYQPTPLESESMIYGVRWDSVNDVMQPGVVVNGSFLATDYANFPIQEQCGRGLLTTAGAWTKLHPRDSAKFVDGSTATIDGSAGQVMVQIPRFYQVIKRAGDYVYFLVSSMPFIYDGVSAWVPLGFRDQAFRYCGAFQGVSATDALEAKVISAVKDTSAFVTNIYPNPFTNRNRAQFRTQIADGVFHQFDWGLQEILNILFLTKYKTWNSQAVLPGHTEGGAWDYAKAKASGLTLALGDFDGSIWDASVSGYVANNFLGIENIFGGVWHFIDGINIDNRTDPLGECRVWVNYDPDTFADDTTDNYTDSGHAPAFGSTSNYIEDILGSGKYCPFYPSVISSTATSSTYITDYHWNSTGAWRVARGGGALLDGARAGFAALHVHVSSASATPAIGARPSA